MIWVQFAVVLVFIFLGARMGSIGIGFAGGAGVIVLGLLGLEVDPMTGIPWDVIGIIMSVISAIAAMQPGRSCYGHGSNVQRLLEVETTNRTFFASRDKQTSRLQLASQ